MIDLDTLVFPKLLPGHKWVVFQDDDSCMPWDTVTIAIRKDRRFFSYLGYSRNCFLTKARERLKKAGYGDEDSEEQIPDDEQAVWRMYIMKSAEALHSEYVERHKIPIKYQKIKEAVDGWQEELNDHLYRD